MKMQKSEKGFTLIEVVVVVAMLGIISAMIIPAFGRMMAKAKLTADVTTIQTLQNQIDIYHLDSSMSTLELKASKEVSSKVLQQLVDAGYLDSKSLIGKKDNYKLNLQSGGVAKVTDTADGIMIKLDLSGKQADQSVKNYVDGLSEEDAIQKWLV